MMTNPAGAAAATRVLALFVKRARVPWWRFRTRWRISRAINAAYAEFERVK